MSLEVLHSIISTNNKVLGRGCADRAERKLKAGKPKYKYNQLFNQSQMQTSWVFDGCQRSLHSQVVATTATISLLLPALRLIAILTDKMHHTGTGKTKDQGLKGVKMTTNTE